ncbi:hypothetical protein SELMODRAFT_405240 [Selaginella moellendorffii]|uniref:Uncharacterized protein n=1 Tax=Selaginella moellendorffii TaxID=88036 RepID=D8QWQ4_SELML|nr:hypothetical protein SELMODRAFT_405240 [Selaginella moellendorffii]
MHRRGERKKEHKEKKSQEPRKLQFIGARKPAAPVPMKTKTQQGCRGWPEPGDRLPVKRPDDRPTNHDLVYLTADSAERLKGIEYRRWGEGKESFCRDMCLTGLDCSCNEAETGGALRCGSHCGDAAVDKIGHNCDVDRGWTAVRKKVSWAKIVLCGHKHARHLQVRASTQPRAFNGEGKFFRQACQGGRDAWELQGKTSGGIQLPQRESLQGREPQSGLKKGIGLL